MSSLTKVFADGSKTPLTGTGEGQRKLTRVVVQSGAMMAVANSLIPVDTTNGNVSITIPTGLANGDRIAVKHIIQGGTNSVSILCSGTDKFNRVGGPTSISLPLVNQAVTLQHDSGILTVVADDITLSSIRADGDTRYASIAAVAGKVAKGELLVSVKDFGAVGDGVANDVAAINAALGSNRTVVFPPGTYRCVGTITASNLSNLRLEGHGASIVQVTETVTALLFTGCNRVSVAGLNISHATQSARTGGGFGIKFANSTDISATNNVISQVCSAGIYTENCNRGTISGNTVRNNLSDGIHTTGASTDISVLGNHTINTGDDGIAVVSYQSNGAPCKRITITGNTVFQSNARGISVVGGENVVIGNNVIRDTRAAGVIVAWESSYNSFGVNGVSVSGNYIEGATTYNSPTTTHTSIFVSGGSTTYLIQNVSITGNTVVGGGFGYIRVFSTVTDGVTDVSVLGNVFGGEVTLPVLASTSQLLLGAVCSATAFLRPSVLALQFPAQRL